MTQPDGDSHVDVSVGPFSDGLPSLLVDPLCKTLSEEPSLKEAYFFELTIGEEAPGLAVGLCLRHPQDEERQSSLLDWVTESVHDLFHEHDVTARFLFLDGEFLEAVQQIAKPFFLQSLTH